MKKFKLFICLLFVTVFVACGQQKKYINYTVQKGETLKSIAKDNGIKAKEIQKLNPDVPKKPAPNTVIIIPNKNYNSSQKADSNQVTHTVKKKENLFSISQLYGVTVDAIKEANNLTGENISIGRVLVIPPKSEVVVEVEEIQLDSTFVWHTVVKDDTIYNLTRRYEITEGELYELNPDLNEGLKLGMNLNMGIRENEEEETAHLLQDSITSKPISVLLMLPYMLNDIDVDNEEFTWDDTLLNIVTDFHGGALVAVDSLRQQGMNIQLEVVDTENSSSKISSILDSRSVNDVDVIVGPLFLKNAKYVAAKSNKTVIAPVYSKTQAQVSDTHLTKVAPNKDLLEEKVLDYMLNNYHGEKIIVSGDASAKTSSKIAQINARLKSHDSISEITVLQPEEGYIKKERFIEVIDTVQYKNWVLLVGDDNIVTADVVNNLGVMPLELRDIRLFSFEKGNSFENVNNDHLARLKFTYPDVHFIDPKRVETQSFEKLYKAKNYVRPSHYATKGFDVTYDAIMRLSDYKNFNEGAKAGISRRVGTKFEYDVKLFGGIENKGIFLLQYQDNLELVDLE